MIYLFVGLSITICQALISSNEDRAYYGFSDMSGLRFAYGTVLILTGIFFILLMSFPKKRTSIFFCLYFAIASLVLASLGNTEIMWENSGRHFDRNNIHVYFPQIVWFSQIFQIEMTPIIHIQKFEWLII